MRDEIAAIKFVISNSKISGPVNLTAPEPATNAEVTKAMSKVFNRPSLLPVPAFALKAILGEFSQEVLGSARVIPRVLMDAGFEFQDPDIESAMRTLATK
jgi:NAD dependent epimerase/dehydratase family enzyme